MTRKILIILTAIVLLGAIVPNASAANEKYMAKIAIKYIQDANNNNTWQSVTKYLNVTETVKWGDITFGYDDIDTDKTSIWFTVTGTGEIKSPHVLLSESSPPSCVRGSCTIDPLQATTDAIQLQLLDIILTSKTSSSNTTDGNPISVYAIVGSDKKYLIKDGSLTFDAKGFTQDSGWSSDKIADEIKVYFERNGDVEAGVDLDTTAPEPAKEWNNDWILYTIENSGTYKWTVSYTETSPWGKDTDKEATYTLIVKGISGGTTTQKAVATTPFDATLNEPKSIKMSAEGAFEPQDGVTIVSDGDNTFRATFNSLGEKQLIFKPTDPKIDSTTVLFNVRAKETTPSSAVAGLPNPVTGNQQQPGGEGEDNTYLLLGSAIIIGVVIYVIYSKRKKTTKSYNIHGTAQ